MAPEEEEMALAGQLASCHSPFLQVLPSIPAALGLEPLDQGHRLLSDTNRSCRTSPQLYARHQFCLQVKGACPEAVYRVLDGEDSQKLFSNHGPIYEVAFSQKN